MGADEDNRALAEDGGPFDQILGLLGKAYDAIGGGAGSTPPIVTPPAGGSTTPPGRRGDFGFGLPGSGVKPITTPPAGGSPAFAFTPGQKVAGGIALALLIGLGVAAVKK